jgi:formylglycine-generating enzyme required for sulfatase activity
VTVGQFRQFTRETGYKTEAEEDGQGSWGITPTGKFERDAKYNWTRPGFEQTDNHPVVDVSWHDAKAFCQWLSEKEKKTYRLPTEAEWEYACRAGTRTAYYFGDDPEDLLRAGNVADRAARESFKAWSLGIKGKDSYAYSAPVGQFRPNRFGLYDMHGNVWEWCEDWYDPKGYSGERQTDPKGPASGERKVHRGGGWSSASNRCRSASRIGRHHSTYRGCYLGFRVVLTGQHDTESSASVDDDSPRIVNARDLKLNREFEYLVYDLGKDIELKLVKVKAKGKTFSIGTSKQEQHAVAQEYFDGKRPPRIDFEDAHVVTMTADYYMGRCEVTRGQFRRFVGETGYLTETERTDGGYGWNKKLQKFEGRNHKYSWRNTGIPSQSDEHPVTNITRNDAREFCRWLGKKSSGKVRLPGEAEWEFACRAGSRSRFSFGDDERRLVEFANVSDESRKDEFPDAKALKGRDGFVFMSPVGQLKPNAFGLYDMHGNAWEWCEDYFGKYSALPKQGNGLQRSNQGEQRPVMRGGAWYVGPGDCRCAKRWLVGIKGRYGSGGFRVVCVP